MGIPRLIKRVGRAKKTAAGFAARRVAQTLQSRRPTGLSVG